MIFFLRFLDDWRGHRCGPDMDYKNPQKKTSTDGLWSGANTQYHLEGKKVKKMVMSGSLVKKFSRKNLSQFFFHT